MAKHPTERYLDDLPDDDVLWLWESQEIIPRDEITILVGWDGHGKTTFMLNFGAALTRGEISGKPEKVFYSMQEDSHKITRARLEAAGADPLLCSFQPKSPDNEEMPHWTFPEDLGVFEQHLMYNGVDIVILDSLDVHVDGLTGQKGRQTMARLHDICDKRGVTMILIHHFNKTGTEVDKAIGGGRGIKAASRCTLVWGEKPKMHYSSLPQLDESDPEYEQKKAAAEQAMEDFEDATHVLAVHKNSHGVKYPYRLSMLWQSRVVDHPKVKSGVLLFDHLTDWLISPQQVYRPQGITGGPASLAGSQTAKAEIKDMMFQVLAIAGDWVPAEELNSLLLKSGVSSKTIATARSELAKDGLIEKRKEGKGGWAWRVVQLDLPMTE